MTDIVIVGGGYAGSAIVKGLSRVKGVRVTLVEPREMFSHNVAAPRAIVDESTADRMFIPYTGVLGTNGTHVRGFVSAISYAANQVELRDGSTIAYDYLVLATGTTGPDPFRMQADEGGVGGTAELKQRLATLRDRVASAARVVVVGGGATGIETAAEISETFPDKSVLLVASGSRLLQHEVRVVEKESDAIAAKLRAKGVEIRLGSRWSQQEDEAAKEAGDEIIWATGVRPATSFIPRESLDENGEVLVDQYLRVQGAKHGNVFAAGDIVSGVTHSVTVAKMAHAKALVGSLKALNKNKQAAKLSVAKDGPNIGFMVTLGHDSHAVGMMAKMFAGMKAKDALLGMYWKDMKVKH